MKQKQQSPHLLLLPQRQPALEAPLILIVDDTPEIAGFIYQILHAKYRCRIAENGKIGVEMAMELSPDLIIADVMMPVMDGLEMVRRLKKHIPTSTIPIILLTAKNDKETELESIRLNIEVFIPKPFEPDILLSRVEQLLAAWEMHGGQKPASKPLPPRRKSRLFLTMKSSWQILFI